MSKKTYKLTEDQLKSLISDAVANVIGQLDNVEITNGEDAAGDARRVNVGQFTDDELREAMNVMAANRGKGEEPKVGIFWYNVAQKQLFGVVTHKRTDYLKPNAGGGLITCSEMHEDVWKKEFYKQKFHNNGKGPFIGEYQNKPRGRVFYSPHDDVYIIAVGAWIDNNPEAVDMIFEEFDLPKDKTIVKKASHWDIGQTWNDD